MLKQILKLFFSYQFYRDNIRALNRNVFKTDREIEKIFEAIELWHTKYEADIQLSEFRSFFYLTYPNITEAQQENFNRLFDLINGATVNPDYGRDLIQTINIRRLAKEIAQEAISITDGETDNFTKVRDLLARADNDFLSDDIQAASTNIEDILKGI